MNRAKLVTDGEGKPYGVRIDCPGCGDRHVLPTVPGHGAQWTWNGSLTQPTFSPSLLVRTGHYCNPGEQLGNCWCDYAERFPDESHPVRCECYRCHSFIRDGRIQFLSDCTHALAGQTVDLPEIDP